MTDTTLPRWNVDDLHESLDARSFTGAMEQLRTDIDRLVTTFDEHGIRAIDPRRATADAAAADAAITGYNAVAEGAQELVAYVYATVSTDSRNERGQAAFSEVRELGAKLAPPLSRLADWLDALRGEGEGVSELAALSEVVAEHAGPLGRLADRASHQMIEANEALYAELATVGSGAWARLQADVTSQLATIVSLPDGSTPTMPMPAIRGLATHVDPAVRRAAYDAELAAWPTVAVPVAAALNAIKGEANIVNRKRRWASPLDASLYANAVAPATFDAMQSAVRASLPDFRRWMKLKAALHGSTDGLHWADLVAPIPIAAKELSWDEGLDVVREAFDGYGPQLTRVLDQAIDERWIDAEPRDGKVGGAFCMSVTGGRSLVLLNWSDSAESAQTTAHELGHAYHNTTLAERTALQRRLPMALAETASIFCETLVVDRGLARLDGDERLALLDLDLGGANQVVVDIHSRFLFETEVFARRQQRTLSPGELNELMLSAQADAYGDGLDQRSAHPYMWLLKSHYYGSHFYNWPYTYGLLFGLGLFARYQDDAERFRSGYETMLSRAGMDTAEELGNSFGLDVGDEAFWTASLDVLRSRIDDYERLAAPHLAAADPSGRPSDTSST